MLASASKEKMGSKSEGGRERLLDVDLSLTSSHTDTHHFVMWPAEVCRDRKWVTLLSVSILKQGSNTEDVKYIFSQHCFKCNTTIRISIIN